MSEPALVYESLDPITAEAAEAVFRTGSPREISRAILRLSLHGPDWELAERRGLELTAHPDVWVRRNAATALGHISRVHGKLDLDLAMPALVALLRDPEVADYADAALDDVEHYLGADRHQYLGRRRTAGL